MKDEDVWMSDTGMKLFNRIANVMLESDVPLDEQVAALVLNASAAFASSKKLPNEEFVHRRLVRSILVAMENVDETFRKRN